MALKKEETRAYYFSFSVKVRFKCSYNLISDLILKMLSHYPEMIFAISFI